MTQDVPQHAVVAMLRVAYKEGCQAGFDWPKLYLADVHKQQLYETWLASKQEGGAEPEEEDCGCHPNAE